MDMLKAIRGSLLFISFVLLVLIGCGGGSTPPPPPVPMVSPTSATVALSATQQFNLTSGTGTGAILTATWSVNGVQGGNSTVGTIDSTGKYTAPASFPSPNTLTVTGTATTGVGTGTANLMVVFPNDNHLAQSAPVKLGTTGGNATDFVDNGTSRTCCSGTLGSLLQRGGTFFVLSNNHVLNKSDTGSVGQAIQQPGLVDNQCDVTGAPPAPTVGTMSEAAALKPTTIITTGPCAGQPAPCGDAPSNVDAAIAAIVTGQVDTTGTILDLGAAGASSIAAAPPSATLATPSAVLAANEGVAKSGRSTGLTCSTLQAVNVTVSVVYDASCGGAHAFTAVFNNQVIVNGGSFSAAGDSGSLIVTSDTARPVALLYGGNTTTTSANPIQDVITAFTNGSGTPAIVGATDHPVSCVPTGNLPSAPPGPSAFAALSSQERERAFAAQRKNAPALMQDPAVRSVIAGASLDNPQEGALVIQVSGDKRSPIPAVIDGVRTRIVAATQTLPAPLPVLNAQDMDQAIAVKDDHADALMSQPGGGVQGVGVGRSDDNPAEAAIVIYVVTGVERPAIPATLDGIRTKIVKGDRFRAFGWGKETAPATKCTKK
ncbi:MAG TPA: hypothetical protein VI488_14690 [Candidatus Angelobacter sp.]